MSLDDSRPGAPTPAVRGHATGPARGNGETILLVDDEPLIVELVTRALRSLGYRVLPANGAPGALEIAVQLEHIDLLLTDIVMPVMNGRELAAYVQALAPGTKCLYMSGYEDRVFAARDGADAPVLSKPFSIAALASAVRAILDAPAAAYPDNDAA